MTQFSWTHWLQRFFLPQGRVQRYQRRDRLASLELLEQRTLLSGISLVKDINPGPSDSSFSRYYSDNFVNPNGTLFFVADDGVHGTELWKSDGTSAGTVLVADLTPGAGDSYLYNLTASDGKVFFKFDDGTHGRELWVSDGTEAGTKLVKDINPTGTGVRYNEYSPNIVDASGTVFFIATDGTTGQELWKSDGTANGTVMVADLTAGNNYDSYIYQMTPVGNKLFFVFDDDVTGLELWSSNGTAGGTQIVKDIDPGSGDGLYASAYYRLPLVNVNGTLFFVANDGIHGAEIWKSNGSSAGTVMVADLTPGEDYSYVHGLTASGGKLYFVFDDQVHGYELWVTDGTEPGTQLTKDINPNGDGLYSVVDGARIVDNNGVLYFIADDGTHGKELWKSNGTAAGTLLVADLTTVPNTNSSSSIYGLTSAGGLVYFAFDDGTHGLELWQSNGTAAGTVLVQDLNPNGNGAYPGYDAHNSIDLNGTLVFLADNGQTGVEVFKIDDNGQPGGPVISDQDFNLAENSANGAVVGTVVATDPSTTNLTYSITNGNGSGAFAINASTGQITVANASVLDFETTPTFALTVQVKNVADLTSTATVTIHLTNVNETPVLTPATFEVDVSSTNGATVGTVTATDPDVGQQLTYSITNGNTSNAFAINPATGQITVANAAALDLSVNPSFTLTVQVVDDGTPSAQATTTVTINLVDANDQNDVPVLALNGGPVTFTKKSPPIAIAPNITVTDPDQSVAFRLGGGVLVASIDLATKKKKVFDTIGGLGNASSIGSISQQGTVNGRFQITIQLDDLTTAADVQAFLRSLTFTTKGAGLKKTTRTLQAQVTDAAGATSNLLQQTINVLKKPAP